MLNASRDKLDRMVEDAWELLEADNLPDAQVGVALLAVEIVDDSGNTAFMTFCTDRRAWIQRGLLQEAVEAVTFAEVEADGD
jgi:hypothetical protein